MKKTLLSIAAVSAVAAAAIVPAVASAQPYYGGGGDRVARLDQRIDMGIRNGDLNRREA